MSKELSKEEVREIYDNEAKYYDLFESMLGLVGLTNLRRKLARGAY